jgi:cupin fold WbuC family metalloprotein
VLLFRNDGCIERIVPIVANGSTLGVDIPAGAWHAMLSLESGSVFFETKPGPYAPLSGAGFAPWAPAEGSDEVPAYLAELERAVQRFLGTQP